MKGLDVLKRFLVSFSLVGTLLWGESQGLTSFLSENQNKLFDYRFGMNTAQSKLLTYSWVNPILMQYTRSFSEQFSSGVVASSSFSVGIDQPIFRSGGIYFAMKYAKAQGSANATDIALQKRQAITEATRLLFSIKRLALQEKKSRLLLANDKIDIRQKREQYQAGLMDSSFLDQAILKANIDESQLLSLQMSRLSLEERFAQLSDKDPKSISLPHLHLIKKHDYIQRHLELKRERLRATQKEYEQKMTWAKYLPTLSLQGRYIYADPNPLFPSSGVEEHYWTYGLTVSMPIDMKMFTDIEAKKLDALRAKVELLERQKSVNETYKQVLSRLKRIEQKIALSQKDEKLYRRLYRITKGLVHSGEKSSLDLKMMSNGIKIRQLDQKMYAIDKELELLTLYTKVEDAI